MTSEAVTAVHEKITASFIEDIKKGIADPAGWKPAWHSSADAMRPENVATGHIYRGGNRFILAMHAMLGDDDIRAWGTFKQWQGLTKHAEACTKERTLKKTDGTTVVGKPVRERCEMLHCEQVSVRKGEHAAETLLRPVFRKELNDLGSEYEKLVGFAAFKVFHNQQVDGWTPPPPPPQISSPDTFDDNIKWAQQVGARVRARHNTPSYHPHSDTIIMPPINCWQHADDHFGTLAHEVVHWTGAKQRLDRAGIRHIMDPEVPYSKETYAKEELVAELGSAFLLAHYGRTTTFRSDHASYLAHWLNVLSDEPELLFKSASQAERASGYILGQLEKNQVSADAVAALA